MTAKYNILSLGINGVLLLCVFGYFLSTWDIKKHQYKKIKKGIIFRIRGYNENLLFL